ncbi:MAG: hypothetical protein QOH21_1111 [Acidobacteriota bacterium]|jgi:hypothetical protein|nr:hypothetical protein [Acidobacteriota bacterium]
MKILVILPDAFDRHSFARDNRHEYVFFEAAPSHWQPTPEFDPREYLERALVFARDANIDAVLSTHDLGDLIAAVIAKELNLRGPTPEAVFLCLHKYYARRRESDPIRCEALPLHGETPQIGYPSFLKAPWLKLGLLGFKLENDAQLASAMELARVEYPRWSRQYYPLFARAVDTTRYPLATADMMLVEEFVEGPQVTVEGWVQDGETHIWAVTDTNTYPGTRIIDNFSLPSRFAAEAQDAMTRYAKDAIRRFEFTDGFFNIELWQTADGLRLTEVNGRAAVCFAGIYDPVLGASIFEAVADVACGLPPRGLPQLTGRVAGQFNLITFAEDYAGNLADYSVAETIPELSLFRADDEYVKPMSEFGVVLGQLEIAGDSYDEIHARAEEVRRRVLKPQ